MVNKLLIGAVLVLLFFPLAIAATEINIKTLPNAKMNIFVQSAEPPLSILEEGSFLNIESGPSGETSVSFVGSESKARINIKVTRNGKEIIHEIFENMPLGNPLYLQVIPGEVSDNYKDVSACESENLKDCDDEKKCTESEGFWYGDTCNEVECDSDNLDLCASETTCTTANGLWLDGTCNAETLIGKTEEEATGEEIAEVEDEDAKSGITGFSVFGDDLKKSILLSKAFWVVIASLIAIAILAVFAKHKINSTAKFKPEKLTTNQSEIEEELSRAEKRIEEAQAEIRKIKSKDKIEAAKKRIQKEQEELRKLEQGEEE
jgi:hypothetical protein